jgi:hypothetical protein
MFQNEIKNSIILKDRMEMKIIYQRGRNLD